MNRHECQRIMQRLLKTCLWCHKFLFTNGSGHKFFENHMSWYTVVFFTLPFPFLIFFALWFPDTSIFSRSCYAHETAEIWGVTDHIAGNLFLFLGFSRLVREEDSGAAQSPIPILHAKCA